MALGACGKLSKWILLILNSMLLKLGITMLCFGFWLRFNNATKGLFDTAMLNTSAFVTGVTVLISLGVVLVAVAVFGCIAAYKESRWSLRLFAVLLTLLVGSMAVFGVLTYTRREAVGAELLEFYITVYALYVAEQDPAITVTLTLIHRAFQCCGNLPGLLELDVVKQTCPKPSTDYGMVPTCPEVIPYAIHSKVPAVMGVFLGAGGVLLAALAFTVILLRKIKQGARITPWSGTV